MRLMSVLLQIPFEICKSYDIKNWIFKLQLEAYLVSQGITLIFTAADLSPHTLPPLFKKNDILFFMTTWSLLIVLSSGSLGLLPSHQKKALSSQKSNTNAFTESDS